MLLSIELAMVSIILIFLLFSFLINDSTNQVISILVLTVAAAETVLGISLLINFINLRHDIQITAIDEN
jgi:NADH-quinone oxidoreductase subunit K